MDKTPKKPYDAENLNESLKVIQLLEELRLSSIRGNLERVKSVIEKGGISVNQTLKGGWSPLLFACSMGHPDVVEYLLKQGADPDFHKEKFTALMAACASTRENEFKLVKCVELLKQHGADVDATERHRISALMFAAKEGHSKIVSKLISYKCQLDLQDSQGWTALFWAVNQGKVKVVKILVEENARIDIKDRRQQTAVDLAQSKGLDEVLSVFHNKNSITTLSEMDNLTGSLKDLHSMYDDMLNESDENYFTDKSLGDAVLLMRTTMSHLGVLYAGTSHIRLRLQGRRVDIPPEKKYAETASLAAITEKALHQTQILREELEFLQQHIKKLGESDKIVPADVMVQKKSSRYTRVTTLILISLIVVFAYKNKDSIGKLLKR